MSFQKAYLLVEGGKSRIDIWFNPTTLSVTSKARWAETKTGDAPKTYLGGQEEALTLKLGIDKVERARPPTVEFVWGAWTSQPSVVAAVDVETELFDGEGQPLRAWVTLRLSRSLSGPEEAARKKSANPTTKATRRRRGHEVGPGENLALIAQHHYRTPTRWREIADMNDLDDPLRLQAPTMLIVPLEQA
jgi:hypothetical protein